MKGGLRGRQQMLLHCGSPPCYRWDRRQRPAFLPPQAPKSHLPPPSSARRSSMPSSVPGKHLADLAYTEHLNFALRPWPGMQHHEALGVSS